MTILSSQNTNVSIKGFLAILFCVLFIGGGIYIFSYNSFVAHRHAVSNLRDYIVIAEVENADLKKDLYRVLDPVRLEAQADAYGLILDKKPEYLTISLSQ